MIAVKDLIRFILIHALIFDHFKVIFSLKVSENISLFFCFLFSSYWWWYELNDNIFICEVYWTLLYCTIHFYKLTIT